MEKNITYADSAARNEFKLATSSGGGEKRLYVGKYAEYEELLDFYDGEFYADRIELIEYMESMQDEYQNTSGKYKIDLEKFYEENLKLVQRIQTDEIDLGFSISQDGSRVYLVSTNKNYDTYLRSIMIPRVTRICFNKNEFGKVKVTPIRCNSLVEQDNTSGTVCGINRIFYGVPGSGKSFKIDTLVGNRPVERVVFHPDYSYSDFIGQVMPKLVDDKDNGKKISYEFVPGPFTKAVKDAIDDVNNNMHYLVVEELNRGNAAAIFGDVFQILDRKKAYEITNFDIAQYVFGDRNHKVYMPKNLTIYATMNTSDQNVFTLDTAFQRRWEMEYIVNSFDVKNAENQIEGNYITWGSFARVINAEIVKYNTEMIGSEDKQLGAFFAQDEEFNKSQFPQKVLKYLWDDVFKMDRDIIFNENIKSLEDLVEGYKNNDNPIKFVMKKEIYDRMIESNAEVKDIAVEEAAEDGNPVDKFEAKEV